MSDHTPSHASRPEPNDIPAISSHNTGLSAERLRELLAAEDAYTRRSVARPEGDA